MRTQFLPAVLLLAASTICASAQDIYRINFHASAQTDSDSDRLGKARITERDIIAQALGADISRKDLRRNYILVYNATEDSIQVADKSGNPVADVIQFQGGAAASSTSENSRFTFMFVPDQAEPIGSAVITDRTVNTGTNGQTTKISGKLQFYLADNTVLGAALAASVGNVGGNVGTNQSLASLIPPVPSITGGSTGSSGSSGTVTVPVPTNTTTISTGSNTNVTGGSSTNTLTTPTNSSSIPFPPSPIGSITSPVVTNNSPSLITTNSPTVGTTNSPALGTTNVASGTTNSTVANTNSPAITNSGPPPLPFDLSTPGTTNTTTTSTPPASTNSAPPLPSDLGTPTNTTTATLPVSTNSGVIITPLPLLNSSTTTNTALVSIGPIATDTSSATNAAAATNVRICIGTFTTRKLLDSSAADGNTNSSVPGVSTNSPSGG